MQFSPGAWKSHPFHPANNVNGINGDTDGDGNGLEIHTLASPAVTALQEAYVRKVIDTVNDLDNVLYEIANENHPPSTEWQYHMIRFIKEYEKQQAEAAPGGHDVPVQGRQQPDAVRQPGRLDFAQSDGGQAVKYRDNPPPADGKKVILTDTDHLWGIGGDVAWVWKSFCAGSTRSSWTRTTAWCSARRPTTSGIPSAATWATRGATPSA